MGYGMQIPAHRVGGPKNIWDFGVYGLSKSWVMRVSTVVHVNRTKQKVAFDASSQQVLLSQLYTLSLPFTSTKIAQYAARGHYADY